ncbi:hypothetical protein STRDD10_00880 [Streptococcus sp. DD10]|nr:hypothetical protein STRDD10_00880 [Streptococcus sp. DD10]
MRIRTKPKVIKLTKARIPMMGARKTSSTLVNNMSFPRTKP